LKILLLTQWFYPETAPDIKGLQFARELIKHGHEIVVLTGFPNYPSGKIYPGYKMKFYQHEIIDGISIYRVPLYPSHDDSPIKRIFNYLSFALSASILGPFLIKNIDIIHVYAPETVIIPGVILKKIKNVPAVHDIQDLWPDSFSSTGMSNSELFLKLAKNFCTFFYKYFEKIVVLSPGFKYKLVQYGIESHKIEVIYNWSSEISNPGKSIEKKDNDFSVLFAGNMGKAQGLDAILYAAKIIESKGLSVSFKFIGNGVEVENLKKIKNNLSLSNCEFIPRVDKDKIGDYLLRADVLLVHLKDDPLFSITIPSKTQTYLQIGKPILMAVKGDASKLIEDAKAGISCLPGNPEDIAEKIIFLKNLDKNELAQMGNNGKEYYTKNLSLTSGVEKFNYLFLKLKGILDKYER
jgi:glycosyltransferase involved in cell wall biosynthesis